MYLNHKFKLFPSINYGKNFFNTEKALKQELFCVLFISSIQNPAIPYRMISYFSLFGQRKVTKEKPPLAPVTPAARLPSYEHPAAAGPKTRSAKANLKQFGPFLRISVLILGTDKMGLVLTCFYLNNEKHIYCVITRQYKRNLCSCGKT